MQTVQSQVKQVGLNLEIIPSTTAFIDLPSKKPSIWFNNGGTPSGNVEAYFGNGVGNYCGNPVSGGLAASFDALRASVTGDAAAQGAAWAVVQNVLYDEVLMSSFVTPAVAAVHNDKVTVEGNLSPLFGDPVAWSNISMGDRT